MSSVTVTATRWEHGWELAIDGEVVTQSATIADATLQVRDYLDTIDPSIDHSEWSITVLAEGDELE